MNIEEEKLKKSLSLFAVIAMGVGLNIGGALFSAPPEMVKITGSSLIISRLLSALPVLLAIPAYMMLASAYPTTGGNYRYNKLVNPHLAVGIVWILFITSIFGMALMAVTLGKYMNLLLPSLPIQLVSFLILLLFYVINLFNINVVGWVQIVMTGILMIALLMFIGFGIPHVEMANLKLEFPNGLWGIFCTDISNMCGRIIIRRKW